MSDLYCQHCDALLPKQTCGRPRELCKLCRIEHRRFYMAAYNRTHPERNSRIGKSWRARNPDKVKAYRARKKAEREAARASEFRRGGAGEGESVTAAH